MATLWQRNNTEVVGRWMPFALILDMILFQPRHKNEDLEHLRQGEFYPPSPIMSAWLFPPLKRGVQPIVCSCSSYIRGLWTLYPEKGTDRWTPRHLMFKRPSCVFYLDEYNTNTCKLWQESIKSHQVSHQSPGHQNSIPASFWISSKLISVSIHLK